MVWHRWASTLVSAPCLPKTRCGHAWIQSQASATLSSHTSCSRAMTSCTCKESTAAVSRYSQPHPIGAVHTLCFSAAMRSYVPERAYCTISCWRRCLYVHISSTSKGSVHRVLNGVSSTDCILYLVRKLGTGRLCTACFDVNPNLQSVVLLHSFILFIHWFTFCASHYPLHHPMPV